jgi:flagellin
MLQRMNELAVQAANGTNSASDRTSIQNEIDQLTTEIDRVAETTKFNETYLLKGQTGYRQKYMVGHDAGLDGTLADNLHDGKAASFSAEIKTDTDKTIAGTEYHIYDANTDTIDKIQDQIEKDGTINANKVTIDGATYEKGKASQDGSTDVFKLGEEEFTVDQIKAKIVDGAKVSVNDGETRTAVDTSLDKNIQVSTAVTKMQSALLQANKIGVDANASTGGVSQSDVKVTILKKDGNAWSEVKNDDDKKALNEIANRNGEVTDYKFSISKGTAQVAKDLGLQLHVGADADMTNKITVNVEAMTAKNLGVQNLNVVDNTGTAATYAIDAIEDAIKQVSAQRSALGAVQNRLEHTIKNVDNVVENTTAAESRIRDTDMASEMVTYSKNNILAQAGQSMLAQANQSNQGVLSLLG